MFRVSAIFRHRAAFALAPIITAFALATGCDAMKKLPFVGAKEKPAPMPVAVASPTPKPPPQIDYAKIRPNELGRIPVMMYHEVGGKVPKRDWGLQRPIAAFEKDLQLMYDAGFRPVNMSDVMNGTMDVPAGKSPVVITFDDARATQFRLIETPTEQKVDPQCAVGLLEAFHKSHPDWNLKATFFVLPRSKSTIEPFGQPGLGDQKLQYLVDKGFEIGNHSINHRNMSRMTPAQLQAEIGGADNLIHEAVPKATLNVVALPMGIYPKDKGNYKYLVSGAYGGKSYSYAGAMRAAYRPIPSPFNKKFDPLRMERIIPMDNDANGLRSWVTKLSSAGSDRYISDGDPQTVSYPKSAAAQVNTARIEKNGLRINPYVPFGGESGAKPIVSADDAPADTNIPTLVESADAKPVTGN